MESQHGSRKNMSGEHILIVEDDAAILTGLRAKLEIEGYLVSTATDGETARQWLELASPDLLVLDIMLPELDGLSVLRWLRRKNTTLPVLILSARGREEQKVEGLRAGADDYLAKPFGLTELTARIEALLRRTRGTDSTVQIGDVAIDMEHSRVTRDGVELALSRKELALLMFLVRRRNQVLPRETILASVWGDITASDARSIDYHMVNLRKKIEPNPRQPEYLITRHGLGYELALGG